MHAVVPSPGPHTTRPPWAQEGQEAKGWGRKRGEDGLEEQRGVQGAPCRPASCPSLSLLVPSFQLTLQSLLASSLQKAAAVAEISVALLCLLCISGFAASL